MAGKGKISTIVATSVALGAIIGAGIFALSGTAIATAGANALLAFVLVGIVAILIALQSGELVSIMPAAKGGTYSYVYKAFGSELGFVTGIILMFSTATGISVISLSFGSYLSSILGVSTTTYSIPFAAGLILVLAIVNLFGIKKAANSDFILVLIKSAVLVMFVIFAILFAVGGNFHASNFSVSPSQSGISALFSASVIIFFAYSGFNVINTFASSIKGGAKSAVKAILGSVIISIILYVLVIFALLLLLPASSYSIGADPLSFALTAVKAPYWLFLVVGFGALIATASAALSRILSGSRTFYQISKDGLLPSFLRNYDKGRDVAVNGVILSAVIGVVMLFAGNVYIIAAISNFGLLFSYLMMSIVVIHFRRTGKTGQFKSPFYPYLPITAIIAILAFMYGMPTESLLIGVVMILGLLLIYYSLREVEKKRVVRIKLFK